MATKLEKSKLFCIRTKGAFAYYVLATDLIEAIGEAERIHTLKGRDVFVMSDASVVCGNGGYAEFGVTDSAKTEITK